MFYYTNISLQDSYETMEKRKQGGRELETRRVTPQGIETRRAPGTCEYFFCFLYFTILTADYKLSTRRQRNKDQTGVGYYTGARDASSPICE